MKTRGVNDAAEQEQPEAVEVPTEPDVVPSAVSARAMKVFSMLLRASDESVSSLLLIKTL